MNVKMNAKILAALAALSKIFLALCLFVSPLIFFTDLTRNPFNIQTCVLVFAAGALLVLWAQKVFFSGKLQLKYTAADFWFLAFVCAALLSLAANMTPALGSEFLRRGHTLITNALAAWFAAKYFALYGTESKPKTFYALLAWGAMWLFFDGLRGNIYPALLWCGGLYLCYKRLAAKSVKDAVDIFIAVAALACVYGIMQNLGYDMVWRFDISYQFGSRAVSTFGNPNFLSSYIILFAPAVFVYFLQARRKVDALYYALALAAFAAYLAISGARSSWLGAGAGAAVLLCFGAPRAALKTAWPRAAAIAIICLFVFALWPAKGGAYKPSALARVQKITTFKNLGLNAPAAQLSPAWHQRVMMWACAAQMVKEAPLIGKGWGSYQLEFAPCQGRLLAKYPALDALYTQANSAHNDVLETAAQAGVIGLALYAAFFIALLLNFAKKYRGIKDPGAKLFYAALAAGAAAFMADNMLNITAQASITAFAFWFVLSSLNNAAARGKEIKINKLLGAALLALCLAAAICAGAWQYLKIRGDINDFKAHKLYSQNRYAAAAAAARAAINPASHSAETYYTLINSQMRLGDVENALNSSLEAIKYNPHYFEFYLRAAALQNALGRAPEAAQNQRAALQLNPRRK